MMKSITPPLLRFSGVALLLCVACRFSLGYVIGHGYPYMAGIAIGTVYGLSVFIAGYYFGKKEADYLPIYDVGFRFHFATYLVHNGVSELYLLFGLNPANEHPQLTHLIALMWSAIVLVHGILYLISRKNSIGSLNKKELFD